MSPRCHEITTLQQWFMDTVIGHLSRDFENYSQVRLAIPTFGRGVWPVSDNFYSLRIPSAEDERRVAAFMPGAAHAHFTLSPGKKAVTTPPQRRRALYCAIAAALALHLAILAFFIVRPAAFSPHERGAEEGMPENLNVSVISEADLRSLSSDPLRQDGHTSPTPTQEPSPEQAPAVPTPPQPDTKEANAAASPLPAKPNEKRDFDPSSFIAMASEQFSSQITHAFSAEANRQEAKRSSLSAGNVKLMRPGATHTGKSDEFARAVIWALAATKPMGNGKWGSVIVTFSVSATGQVEGLRLLKSSGDNWLDQGALMAVKQARMPVPSPGLPFGDRAFNIEYISLPSR
jgi:periplasmic protein TonB